jgi:membrane protein required for colicin V production
MTTYDAAMVIVVVLGMIRGAWRGFTWQVASLTSLVLGYISAHTSSSMVAAYLPGDPEVQRVLAMSVIYVAVSGGIFAIAWMIRGTLRKLRFEAYDRHLGMLLGGLEGMGVGMLATLMVVSLAPAARQPIFSSTAGHIVGAAMNSLGPVLPGEVRRVLAPHWERVSADALASHEPADDSGDIALSTRSQGAAGASPRLPDLHEAQGAAGSGLSALPALEPASEEDQAVHRASGSPRSDSQPSGENAQGVLGLDEVLERGTRELRDAFSESIDRELHRLESGPPKGRP